MLKLRIYASLDLLAFLLWSEEILVICRNRWYCPWFCFFYERVWHIGHWRLAHYVVLTRMGYCVFENIFGSLHLHGFFSSNFSRLRMSLINRFISRILDTWKSLSDVWQVHSSRSDWRFVINDAFFFFNTMSNGGIMKTGNAVGNE